MLTQGRQQAPVRSEMDWALGDGEDVAPWGEQRGLCRMVKVPQPSWARHWPPRPVQGTSDCWQRAQVLSQVPAGTALE